MEGGKGTHDERDQTSLGTVRSVMGQTLNPKLAIVFLQPKS